MKIQTFNRQLIRQYMLTSPILEDGIQYCQYITPGASREAAKESAIRLAEEYCERKWYNDSTGYIRNEFIAFQEFESDVRNNRYFYDKGMEAAAEKKRRKEEEEREQKARWDKEASRVRALREYCYKHKLDFEIENQKALAVLKKRDNLSFWLQSIAFLAFFGSLVMWVFTSVGSWLVWLPILIVSIIVFFVTDSKISPKLPKDFFEKIKNGTYRFDA